MCRLKNEINSNEKLIGYLESLNTNKKLSDDGKKLLWALKGENDWRVEK